MPKAMKPKAEIVNEKTQIEKFKEAALRWNTAAGAEIFDQTLEMFSGATVETSAKLKTKKSRTKSGRIL